MSDTQNPWQAPSADLASTPSTSVEASGDRITDKMTRWLVDASPWIRFLAVMSFIGAGFVALTGLSLAISGAAIASFSEVMPAGTALGMGLLYIVMALLMFFPARFLWLFGTKIKTWKQNGNTEDLEKALENNKSFWKFSGILTIISLVIGPIIMMLVVIFAASIGLGAGV